MLRSRILFIACVLCFALSLSACQNPFFQPGETDLLEPVPTEKDKGQHEQVTEPEPAPTPPTTVTLAAAGDIMMHSTQIKAARQSDGSYDFHDVFADIRPYLQAADLGFANLETTFGGNEPYSGYPMFNAPDEVADARRDEGQDAGKGLVDGRALAGTLLLPFGGQIFLNGGDGGFQRDGDLRHVQSFRCRGTAPRRALSTGPFLHSNS